MRIIFQDGGVAELTNVDQIAVNNEGECKILAIAVTDYISKEGINEYPSSETSGDGSVSERNLAPESTQHAGQSSVRNLSKLSGTGRAKKASSNGSHHPIVPY